ncbi:hypothetical protein [Peptostreptococcus stomatis]|uniref:hypothetical protein n=1 Tax=Peptostreptococcus stomatis TaxID=341694 RepID=UPI0026EACA13|nr:hypothetical protein [Peptostreptococcus stomatis]
MRNNQMYAIELEGLCKRALGDRHSISSTYNVLDADKIRAKPFYAVMFIVGALYDDRVDEGKDFRELCMNLLMESSEFQDKGLDLFDNEDDIKKLIENIKDFINIIESYNK